jgi:5'-3' exonuclease
VELLIDGDLIVYKCCFSVKKGDFIQTVEAVDSTMDFILGRFDYPEYRLFLTGKKNFRKEITDTYKANRDPSKRPKFYKEVREYLTNFYGAEVQEPYEADDLIGMNHVPGETVCVSFDKDLNCLEGTHFDWKKNEVYDVTYPDNIWFFYYQLLVGDQSDAIKGVPKIGDVKARKLLDKEKPDEWRGIVEGKYQEAFGDQWFSNYDTTARLLHILRDPSKQYYDYL